jgi:BASS family bile acid:Na+ symporter
MLNRLCEWFTRLMVVWIVLAGVAGYLIPDLLTPVKPHMNWLFAFTMLGIGLTLKPEDFTPIFTKPQLVVLGTLAQFAIMPALGFLIAKALRLEPDLAVGLILVGSSPGRWPPRSCPTLPRPTWPTPPP